MISPPRHQDFNWLNASSLKYEQIPETSEEKPNTKDDTKIFRGKKNKKTEENSEKIVWKENFETNF